MKRGRIDMRIPEKDKAIWVEEADVRGLELSELIRRSVPHYLAANPRPRKRTKRAKATA